MAGTTGSGKSEVIQSIIASLAVEYHPHDMAFMLIDYKGGGMSNTFQELPHVIATVTNLEEEGLIERSKVSLKPSLNEDSGYSLLLVMYSILTNIILQSGKIGILSRIYSLSSMSLHN